MLMLDRNADIELRIDAMGSQGQGIGRLDGFAVFVPYTLPGELVRAHVIKPGKSFAVAKLTKIIEKSDDRCEAPCRVFGKCGGCAMMEMAYKAQLETKTRQVRDALERIGGFRGIEVPMAIGMDDPFRYRNKASFPICADVDGTAHFGFYAPRSHRLINLDDCPIEREELVLCAKTVTDWARKYKISCYDETTGRGVLRHVVGRITSTGDVMTVVVTSGQLPHKDELIALLRERVPGIVSIVHNVNAQDTNVIFGEKFETVYGADHICEKIAGLSFEVSAASFLQVNPSQTEKLYALVKNALPDGEFTAVDVYCGTGTLTLIAAQKAKKAVGIEYIKPAVQDALRNAGNNGISNAEFICGDAADELPKLIAGGFKPDVIIVDPPRKGCDDAVTAAMAESGVERIIYVSCDPATLARDAKKLAQAGYAFASIQSVDMFPHTSHVETVAVLERKK